MKKLLALAALLVSAVLATTTVSALEENLFGLYYDRAATIAEIEIAANSQQVLYLVLINPVSDYGSVQLISAFECSIVPATGDYVLGVTFPLEAINIFGGVDNMFVGYAQGLQVESGGGTTLATISVLTMGNNPEGYKIQPASPASIPQFLAYEDSGGPDRIIVSAMPVSGSFTRPVFRFGDYTVNRKWGDVKSLYR